VRINTLTSAANPLLKKIRSTHERAARQKAGLFLLEGEKIIVEALERGLKIEALVADERFFENEYSGLEHSLTPFEALDEINVVPTSLFRDLYTTATSCGVVALAVPPQSSLEAIVEAAAERRASGKPNSIVLLENIQDPGNLGTIIRSALAFDATAVILSHGTVDPYNPKVVRAAMGALFELPVLTQANLGTIQTLKSEGFALVTLNPEAKTNLRETKLPADLILLLGNEGAGLSDEATAEADFDLRIEMSNRIESLNVSIAAALVLGHVFSSNL
jgi:TrmH family RNA methyltransferase